MCGELPRGTRIVEERIAETLGLSRTPIREALQRLRSEGLLVRVRRGQLEVATVGDEERGEIHLIRVAIDEVVARLLTRKASLVAWPDLYALLDALSSGDESRAVAAALSHALRGRAAAGPGELAGVRDQYRHDPEGAR
jgi:DNA-binding GntR family transcriptional regulator